MMIYSPLASGVLTGKYKRGQKPPTGSRAERWREMRESQLHDRVFDVVEAMEKIAREQSVALNQLTMMWLLAKPYATTLILGGSKPEHFTTLYEVADRPLDRELEKKIDEISEWFIYKKFRNQPRKDGPGLAARR
jgi:1-deoxyxylulose-5-phosphate synthase